FNARFLTARVNGDLMLSFLIINRGNRAYHLTAITNPGDHDNPDVPAFFRSFTFTDYPQLQWHQKKDTDYGFTVPVISDHVKSQFLDTLKTIASANREYQWTSYDPSSATTFYVTRRLITPYLWVKHDSLLLKKYMDNLTGIGETRTWYKFVRNGNSSGIEFNLKKHNSGLEQRFRVLLNGPAVYTLQTDVPAEYWKAGYEQFFEDFKFEKEEASSFLLTNSFQKFLKDLESHDSATHVKAYDAIESLIYDSTDVPALLQAASVDYALDSLHYYSTASSLLDVLPHVKHAKLVDVIADHYNSLKPEQEKFKFNFLNALAYQETAHSYSVIEKLLKQGIPAKGDADDFVRKLGDSLELLKKLYPYLITVTSDTSMGTQLFYLHKALLDSGMIKIDEFRAYEPELLKAAKQQLAKAAGSDEDYYAFGIYHMFEMLRELNTDSSRATIRDFLNARQVSLRYYAAVALLKLDQTVDAAALQSIAADKSYRTDLYTELKEQNKEKLFPAKYANQKAFSESYAFNAADEEGSAKLTYVTDRVMSYNGKKYRFYLYKAVFDSGSAYLCISGAFSLDGKKLELADDLSGIYWDEEFSQSAIDKQLKKRIAAYEEYVKDEETAPPQEMK
ncbi:MAG TPA: hypothetical protein VEB42_11540, partial [Chitinophagaceae bacterium]|nr:hypothetical protein [Chitinophagaceae bacterium]